MSQLSWILLSGLLMCAIALVGAFALLVSDRVLERMLVPLVGLAAGSLLGGAFFHLLPAGLAALDHPTAPFVWLILGFSVFLLLETLLHRHHCLNASASCREPVTYLILLGDGLHNLIGGLAVGSAFVSDVGLGITAWLAAAAHEIPQELGDFAVLVKGGWRKKSALAFNLLSALTFLIGALTAYAASFTTNISFLLPFAAGNFIYIAASDLVPELSRAHESGRSLTSFATFALGLLILYVLA